MEMFFVTWATLSQNYMDKDSLCEDLHHLTVYYFQTEHSNVQKQCQIMKLTVMALIRRGWVQTTLHNDPLPRDM